MNTILDYALTILILFSLVIVFLVGYLFRGIKYAAEFLERQLQEWTAALMKELRRR